jgi:uncharacterized protein (TIGR02687 family)
MNRIHDSLQRVFERHRLVFWYDPESEWAQTFDEFADASVTKLRVERNEFGTKVRIVRDPNPDAKFLLYFPSPKPVDLDNWLLDLLLQGYEYKADKASLALQAVGLPHEFIHLALEHASFFASEKRTQQLREHIDKNDQERDVRLKMMVVLAGNDVAVDIDSLLLHFLTTGQPTDLFDPVEQCLEASALVEPFWREVGRTFGYNAATPSRRDFAVSLFRGANPLDGQVSLHPHSKVFLQRWKDSQACKESFREWADQMERELQIETALSGVDDPAALGDWDTFEIFEKFTLHWLCQCFENGASTTDLRERIQRRRHSFWQPQHKEGYAALEHAVELRELLASAELTVESIDAGLSRYVVSWWRIDLAYRHCIRNLHAYGQVQVMAQISQWVERAYLNNFLLPLADRWSDQVWRLDHWQCESLMAQNQFFDNYVKPFLTKGQKVFVIVSDALRFEAAVDFANRLQSANRWTAEVVAMFGSLPSYTQLGMAALLPGKQLALNGENGTVTVDGRSASGTENRADILKEACNGRATAIQAEEFLELNSKTDGRALMRDHDAIYIFHNAIDATGDKPGTEAKTFEAVEQAFNELDLIIKKVANINGTNMLLTADHGFLFQQDEVSEDDMAALPMADVWSYRDRRFAIGKAIKPTAAAKVFGSSDLGLNGDWSAVFPRSLGRFPLQGSGKRYVHGGISLQEVVVPVVKIHKARTDDTGQVEVEILRVPSKITTGQVAVSLFQNKPAIDKTLPRTLRIGLYSKDGKELSEIKTYTFDSKQTEARQREVSMLLALARAADAFNNQDVVLRLEETVLGTNQAVVYKTHTLRLQKPFASDFDEL